jgi:hypothetical protein
MVNIGNIREASTERRLERVNNHEANELGFENVQGRRQDRISDLQELLGTREERRADIKEGIVDFLTPPETTPPETVA